MATNQTVPHVYTAICQVAKALSRDGIEKNNQNQQQGYKFRGIDDVYNALSAVLAGAELCILPKIAERTQEERTTAKGGVLFCVTVKADFEFVSAKDGSSHTVTMYGEAMDSADKATNKAMSAAYKYCCMQTFCIPTEGMDDADAHTPEPAPKHTPAQQAVIDRKLAEARKEPSPTTIKQRLEYFERMKNEIGAATYYTILGAHGFEHANEIKTLEQARVIRQEMEAAFDDQRSRGVA